MKKERFSLSELLLSVGEHILFRPENSFSSYHDSEKVSKERTGRFSLLPYKKKVKGALRKMAEQSAVLSFLKKSINGFFTTRIRSFGVLFFVCGFLQILSYFLGAYVSFIPEGEATLLFGVAQIFLTLLCSFSRGTVSDGLKKSFLYRGLIRPLFGIPEWSLPSGKGNDALGGMFLLGLLFGALSVFFGPVAVAEFLFSIALFLLIFSVPEVGLGVSAAGIMFGSGSLFFLLVSLTLAAFLCKCAVGKRSLVFSWMDLAVFFFLLPLIATEKGVPFFLPLFALYFLASGLIRTLSSLERFMRTVTVVAFLGALFLILRRGIEVFMPFVFLRVPDLGKIFFLEPTSELGLLFAMLCPFVMGYGRRGKSLSGALFSFVTFLLSIGVLVLVKDSGVWLCALLGVAVYLLFSHRWSLVYLVISGLSLITVLQALPVSVSTAVLRFFGLDMSLVSAGGNSPSLVGYFADEGGIFWIFAYFLVVGFILWGCIRFAVKTVSSDTHPMVLGVLSAEAVFFAASFQSISLDGRSLSLFLLAAALPGAAYRCAKREEIPLPY